MNLEQLINELIYLKGNTEPNFENFDNAITNLNEIITKISNMKTTNKSKIIFVGRSGSMKDELILKLIKLELTQESLSQIMDKYVEYIIENDYGIQVDDKYIKFESVDFLNEHIQSNYSKFSSHIKIFYPRSENEILKDKIVMNTPSYNYSDERDDEIVSNCRDGDIFIVVLNSVGSMGYKDKNFLKRLSDNNFIKLNYIFNGIEQVSKESIYITKDHHKTNATIISNEILIPPQENIPIFFVENYKMNEDELKSLLQERNYIDETKKYIPSEKIKQIKENIAKEKIRIDEALNDDEKKLRDYKEQRKKIEENTINKKKNSQIEKLKNLIGQIIKFENESPNYENWIKQNHRRLDFCKQLVENKSIFGEILLENSNNHKIEEMNAIAEEKVNIHSEGNDLKECMKAVTEQIDNKQINSIDQLLEFVINYSESVMKSSNINDNRKSNKSDNYRDKMITENQSNFIGNIINLLKSIDWNNKDLSQFIDKILKSNENISREIAKYSTNCNSYLKEIFQYIDKMLKYLNCIWKEDLKKISLTKISTLPILSDKKITKIYLVEIESFHDLLIFPLLIKILFAMIITENIYKYSGRWNPLGTDYHKENIEILKNDFIKMKFFNKFNQIEFEKYEIKTKYSKSECDSLEITKSEKKKKLNFLEKIEKELINLLEILDKMILQFY